MCCIAALVIRVANTLSSHPTNLSQAPLSYWIGRISIKKADILTEARVVIHRNQRLNRII